MQIVAVARVRVVVFTIVALVLVPWSAQAARIIHVPGDVRTVQGAINAAVDGDTVLVAPGTYRENPVLSKTIMLASHYHTTGDRSYIEQTILDGGGGSSVINIPPGLGPATAIIGFTIRRGNDGIAARSRFQLLHNRIVENKDGVDYESGSGGVARGNIVEKNRDDGFDLDGTVAVVIEDNIIRDNRDDGIEIRLHDYTGPTIEIVIRNNVIAGNREDGIQLIDYPGLSSRVFRIERNLIQGNAMVGLGMMADGNTVQDFSGAPLPEPVFLTNNTIIGNRYGVTGGTNVTARNNIVMGATGIALKNVGGSSSVSHSLFWNNAVNSQASNVDGGTAVLADPLFDATYHLLPGSPAIDAGTEVGLPYNGLAPDLGAYETAGDGTPRQLPATNAGSDRSGTQRSPAQASDTALMKGTSAPPPSALPLSRGLRAFPGAEGFGARAVGGRGGRVIAVTNLNDSGPGSLRAAIEATGPRMVVFRVGGTIELVTPLSIKNPFITIAGQTAPGGGIALKNHPSNTRAALGIDTREVVVRYLRVRPGSSLLASSNVDALLIRSGSNIIIDHCSFSWAVDENVNTWYSPSNVTIQWSVISEALHRSTHSEGRHSMGLLVGDAGSHSISIHHNLFVHNNKRNPAIKTAGTVDFVNNVIHNYGDDAGWVGDKHARVPLNFVGNFYQPGPDSDLTKYELEVYEYGTGYGFSLYVRDNIGPHRLTETEPEDAVVSPNGRAYIVASPNSAPPITTTSPREAFAAVLDGAGATVPARDAVDQRVVDTVRRRAGAIIDTPSQVGSWPVLASGAAPADSDGDGMPDDWERAHGLDPTRDDSARDRDGDGYTNIEEYLNSPFSVTPRRGPS